MGLMMRRRRPMMRMAAGAATAGVAYHMGKAGQQQSDINDQAQMAYASSQNAPAPQYAPAPPPPQPAAPAPAPETSTDELSHLAELHSSGALTDAEFTAAKSKLLGI
jgi:Short C-terminal domain